MWIELIEDCEASAHPVQTIGEDEGVVFVSISKCITENGSFVQSSTRILTENLDNLTL